MLGRSDGVLYVLSLSVYSKLTCFKLCLVQESRRSSFRLCGNLRRARHVLQAGTYNATRARCS